MQPPSRAVLVWFYNLLMDLLAMVLLVVLVCSEAQKMTNVTAEPGQNVTLTCFINHNTIYWFMEVHNKIRAGIGSITSSLPTFYSPDLETRYSMSGNRLVVRNLSVEDSRLYYCGRKEGGRTVYGDPIRLIISDHIVPSPTNSSLGSLGHSRKEWHKVPIVAVSFSLNGVLLVVVLGFIYAYIRRKGCSSCCRAKDSAQYIIESQEMQNPQYEEIQLPPSRIDSECIYSKAQLPGSRLPPC